ncbi:MAG: hypothetical protein KJO07_12125 [Deltaproteobacteria bacterium]|nr:hypothetical protein [Deltaproteobacteria bacterium]
MRKLTRKLVLIGLLGATMGAEDACQENALSYTYGHEAMPGPAVKLLEPDGNFGSNAKVVYHASWNRPYVMFYRQRVPNGNGTIGIRRATSTNGLNWSRDSGWVLRPNGTPGSAPLGCGGAYDPGAAVTADGTILLAYEAEPRAPWTRVLCEPNPEGHHAYVAVARSTDGGRTFSNFQKAIRTVTATNVGTPSVQIWPELGKISIAYHRNDGPPITMRIRTWDYNGSNIQTFADHPNGSWTCGSGCTDVEPVVNWPDGTDHMQPYGFLSMQGGIGKADIIRWSQPAEGVDDGSYYMVFEAFASPGASCEAPNGIVYTWYARAASPTGPYTVSAATPILVDDDPNDHFCNQDMPTWMFRPTTGTYHVLTHARNGDYTDSINAHQLQFQPQ